MRYASLAVSKVGIGEATLREALLNLLKDNPTAEVVFSNVSRNDELNQCETKYWWDYVHGSVPEGVETPHYFALGTAVHDGCEVLLQQHGRGKTMDPRAAAMAARDSLAQIWPTRDGLSPKNFDEGLKFDHWHEDVLTAAARKFELIEKVHCTEQLVWALVPAQPVLEMLNSPLKCALWVCVMGRVDAVIEMNGYTYHLQHKTTSKVRGDYETYVTALGFSGHETVYGWILSTLIERGLVDWAPYAGSVINMLQKRGRPNDAPETLPKGLYDLVEKGKITLHVDDDDPGMVDMERHEKCTDKQWQSAVQLHTNWENREECRVAEIRDFDESVAQFIWADLDLDKIEVGALRVFDSVAEQQRAVNRARDPHLQLRQNHRACVDLGGRPCPRLESKTCGGWEDYNYMDPDSGWARREPDYVNEVEAWYKGEQEDVQAAD